MFYDNLKNSTTLQRIIDIVESTENQDRIEKHFIDYQIVFDDQKKHIIESLAARYPDSWQEMVVINLKISKKIVRKLSRCYAAGVNREVIDKKTGNTHQGLTKLINYIYDDVDSAGRNFNAVMDRANSYYTNHRYVEIFFYKDPKGRIRFKALPQHLFTALPNEDKTESAVIVFKQNIEDFDLANVQEHIDWDLIPEQERDRSEIVAIYTIWSEKENFNFAQVKMVTMDEKNKEYIIYKPVIIQKESNPGGKNPYKIKPFAAVKEITDGHFYPHGSEVAEQGKEMCVIFSDIVSIAAQQGYGQAVIYYEGETPPPVTKSGPTHIINIPAGEGKSKFEFANANPDLKGHLDIALALTRILLTTNDLTTDKVSGELAATNFASAIDRLIADSETIESIEDQRKKYVGTEQNAMKIVMSILWEMKVTKTMPDDYPEINISDLVNPDRYIMKLNWNTIKPLTTEKEKASTIDDLYDKGFILGHEKHMRFNEGMSEPQAKAREKMIQDERKQKAQEMFKEQAEKIKGDLKNARETNETDKFAQTLGGRQETDQKPKNPIGQRQEKIRKRNT